MKADEYREWNMRRGNKYHARRTNGYASAREARRASELRLLQAKGEISNLREQVRYDLLPTLRHSDGTLFARKTVYVADFVYVDSDGNEVVEDAKGYRTEAYRLKRNMMMHFHKIAIREV